MSELKINANEDAAKLRGYEPYKSETEQVLFRAKAIFRASRLQCILWAACYMLLVFASPDWLLMVAWGLSDIVILSLGYFMQLLIPLLFLCLFGWLARLIEGESFAVGGFLDPFRWIKTRSAGRALTIVFTVAMAYLVRDVFANKIPALVAFILRPVEFFYGKSPAIPFLTLVQLFSGEYSAIPMWIQFPLNLPVIIMLQWGVDFFFIHAAITRGQAARGVIHSYGIFKKIFRVEVHLAGKFLLITYVVFFAAYLFARNLLSPAAQMLVYQLFMPCVFLGFGFVYFPRSAIARFLILMQQPRVQLVPAEPGDFHEIDDAYRQSLNEDRDDEEDGTNDDPPGQY